VSACDDCLRRATLLGLAAPYIANALDEHRRLPELLSRPDDELIAAACGRGAKTVREAYERLDPADARRAAAKARVSLLCRHASDFPGRLMESRDAPALIYLRGDPQRLAQLEVEQPVAVVGSRRASPYGLEVARALGRELSLAGIPVVSGMALGIDSAAHEGALAAGGLTVAVLAAGADVPYPRTKRALYRKIVAEGLVVSELPPGASPFRWTFPARNRIMAALGAMTVVVEGAAGSGSLITAGFAADLGRDVGAVPGRVTSALAAGPNALLADGACVVRSGRDVIEALRGPGAAAAATQPEVSRAASLEPRLAALLEAVERGNGSVDAIAGEGIPIATALAGLTELELLGLVSRAGGAGYVRRA
jgi:DNA processing protein